MQSIDSPVVLSVLSLLESSLFVALLYSPITLALAVCFRVINYPDLTCEGSAMVGAATAYVVLSHGGPAFASLAASALAGALAGGFTAILHTHLRVSRLLSGIVTWAILYSISIRLLGGRANQPLSGSSIFDSLNPIRSAGGDLVITALVLVAIVSAWLAISTSREGRILRAVGDQHQFVTLVGRDYRRFLIGGLALANSMTGFCGGMVAQYRKVCDVNMVAGLLVSGLAALVLGEAIFAARRLWQHALVCFVGTWAYNVAVGAFYFDWGSAEQGFFLPSDVRLLTGLLLIAPAIVNFRLRGRYRLFAADW